MGSRLHLDKGAAVITSADDSNKELERRRQIEAAADGEFLAVWAELPPSRLREMLAVGRALFDAATFTENTRVT